MTFDDFATEFRDVPLPAAAQERHRALLRVTIEQETAPAVRTRRRRRLPGLLPGLAAAVLLVGGGTATATYFLSTQAERTDTAFCFGSLSLDEDGGNRVEFAVDGTPRSLGDAAAAGLDICSRYWADGTLGDGTGVPELIACVLPSGHAGIFPGDLGTCSALDLGTLEPSE